MYKVRKSDERGKVNAGWLKSFHTFSFGDYYDPAHMGFGPLRVINEDWVDPASGFGMHPHRNMEIITYVMSGALSHKDSLGNGAAITPGEIQVMSAGAGIMHSEFNHSPADAVHLLQIWIMPNVMNTAPGYQQKPFAPAEMHNALRVLVSPDGQDGSLVIRQDARLMAAMLDKGKTVSVAASPSRKYWLQVAQGAVSVNGHALAAGDGLAIEKEEGILSVNADDAAEVLLFDLPH